MSEFLSPWDAAAHLGVSVGRVRELINLGELSCVRKGFVELVPLEAVEHLQLEGRR